MDKPKSLHGLEQEIIILQDLLEREKLKKAEELLVNRLVLTIIIFLIIFFILCIKMEYASSGVQWLLIILFFGAGLVALGFIAKS